MSSRVSNSTSDRKHEAVKAVMDRREQEGRGGGQAGGQAGADARVDRMVEVRLADALSAAGWDGGRIATELLLLLPRGFKDAYERLFHTALAGGDAGAEAAGKRNQAVAALGKEAGTPTDQTEVRASPGGSKKKHRGTWAIQNEAALRLKERVDKRLRALARDIEEELEMQERGEEGGDGKGANVRPVCSRCSQFVGRNSNFCSNCGTRLGDGNGEG